MEPITINTQMNFKDYYNVNLYMLFRRKVMWVILVLAIIFLVIALVIGGDDHFLIYLALFYFVYLLLTPGIIYLSAKRLYKKIPAMGETKQYEFTSDNLKVTGETVKMETAWSNINKAVKRKDDYILFTSSSKSFFDFPKSAFQNENDVFSFETIVKTNVKKNNF